MTNYNPKHIQEILEEEVAVAKSSGEQIDPETSSHQLHTHKKDPFALEKIEKTKHSFFGFFVTRGRLTLLLILAIVALGSLALIEIPRESDPEVKIPIAVVTTVFPGASPADVEKLITDKIESKIEELDSLKLVTSQSTSGVSSVTVEFEAEANLKESIRNLKDKVLEVTDLPEDATDPIVTEVRIDNYAIITFSLAGPLPENDLKLLGETVQDELKKISGVSDVPLIGTRGRQFQVVVKPGELERLNLSLNQIIGAIASNNADTPLGSITIDARNYSLRATANLDNIEDLNRVVVTTKNGQPIFLSDVATVEDTFTDLTSLARLSAEGQAAITTVSLQVYKKTGGNILKIVDTAKEKIVELQANDTIPKEVTVVVSSDYSQFIRKDLNILGSSGVQSVIMIFIILLFALSYREAVLSLLAIPLTLLITIFVMNWRGDTINSLALFALVLSLGLLVDTFIIILEGIFHNLRLGYTSTEASLLAIAHYAKPLLSSTLTTISAFIPMLLVSGILGEFLQVLPYTISIALFASLFVSLVIVPSAAAVFLKNKKLDKHKQESLMERWFTDKIVTWYIDYIDGLLKNRKRKIKFLGTVLASFIISIGLIVSPLVPIELFGAVDVDFAFIDVEMPVGTDLATTDQVVREVEEYLYSRDDIKTFTTSVGSLSSFGFGSSSSSNEHVANINITFVDEKDRDLKSYEINKLMRQDLEKIQSGKITVQEISSGPPTGAPIEIRITGEDLVILDQLAENLIQILSSKEGVFDAKTNKQINPADLTFKLNHDALAQSNISVPEITGFLRTAIFGVEATEISVGDDDVDVVVKFSDRDVDTVEKIKNLSITNNAGQSFKLSRLADFSLEPSLATIAHRDFKKTATVQANLEPGFSPATIMPEIEVEIKSKPVPQGYEYNFGGEVEDIEQSFKELWSAMIVAVLLILFILVMQFNSYKKPIMILLELPLSMVGVTIGILIFQMPFSFSVFLGIISLAGIAVNDAIVLLDKADRNVKEFKMKPRQAIINAGATRFQPILLTSLTTIVGILPLSWADEFWFGLSIAIMFGMAFTALLQLFILPIIYLQLEGNSILKQLKKEI